MLTCKRICIADEQPLMRRIIRLALMEKEIEVIEVNNALGALEFITANSVDMLIVGQLSDMAELEMVRLLRNKPSCKELPVIIISSRDGVGLRTEAKALKVYRWLKRPFRVNEILAVLDDATQEPPHIVNNYAHRSD